MTKKKTTTKKKDPSIWEVLSVIDCSEHIEKKGGFNYLSWAWAWGMLMEHYPDATFENHLNSNEYPCFMDQNGYAMVRVTLCVDGKCHTEDFMVLDFRNKAVQNPDSFQVNTALKRCLVKAMAYFGLGHYIYAGEDLPPSAKADPLDENFNRDHAVAVVNTYHENDGGDEWLLKVLEHFTASKLGDLTNEQLQQVVKRIESKQNKGDS